MTYQLEAIEAAQEMLNYLYKEIDSCLDHIMIIEQILGNWYASLHKLILLMKNSIRENLATKSSLTKIVLASTTVVLFVIFLKRVLIPFLAKTSKKLRPHFVRIYGYLYDIFDCLPEHLANLCRRLYRNEYIALAYAILFANIHGAQAPKNVPARSASSELEQVLHIAAREKLPHEKINLGQRQEIWFDLMPQIRQEDKERYIEASPISDIIPENIIYEDKNLFTPDLPFAKDFRFYLVSEHAPSLTSDFTFNPQSFLDQTLNHIEGFKKETS